MPLFTEVYTFSKFEIEREADMLFSFNLGWYSVQLDIVHEEQGWMGVAQLSAFDLLIRQNPF